MAKIGFISLGCPKNLVDSEVMIGLLEREGHTITPDTHEAEIIIINTCSFIADAKRESIDAVLAAGELKQSGRLRRLIVTGCLPERYAREIHGELPEIDAILGVNQIEQIAHAVAGKPVPPPDSFGRRDADLYLYDHTTPRTLAGPRHAAYMKVSEGATTVAPSASSPRSADASAAATWNRSFGRPNSSPRAGYGRSPWCRRTPPPTVRTWG